MNDGGLPLIVLEVVLGFLVPIAWGVWELVQLRRHKAREAARSGAAGVTGEGTAPRPRVNGP